MAALLPAGVCRCAVARVTTDARSVRGIGVSKGVPKHLGLGMVQAEGARRYVRNASRDEGKRRDGARRALAQDCMRPLGGVAD